MITRELTPIELLILGLVSEMPRHGYELEQVIDRRGMREWTQIGFSSIYYVLSRLEKRELIKANTPLNLTAKKIYEITADGIEMLTKQTLNNLKIVYPTYPALLISMINWSLLTREQALSALGTRKKSLAKEIERIDYIHFQQQPLPDYVDAMFDFSIGQLKAEADWVDRTMDYMSSKPWNT